MTVGIRIRDKNGNIVLDFNDRITRVLGSLTTTTVNGSVSIPALAGGTPWYYINAPQQFNQTFQVPDVTIDNNGISWSYRLNNKTNVGVSLIYGLY